MSDNQVICELIDATLPVGRRALSDEERRWMEDRATQLWRAHVWWGVVTVPAFIVAFFGLMVSIGCYWPFGIAGGAILATPLLYLGRTGFEWAALSEALKCGTVDLYCAPEAREVESLTFVEIVQDGGLVVTLNGRRPRRVTCLLADFYLSP